MVWLLGLLVLAAVVRAVAQRLAAPPAPEPPRAGARGEEVPFRLETAALDLHSVAPREAGGAVDEFVRDARRRGLEQVKIIHGKGTGILRRRVRARLARHPDVLRWYDAASPGSGRGATVVVLRTAEPPLARGAPPDLV